MKPRPSSTKMRRLCFDAHKYTHPKTGRTVMDCHVCGGVIDPVAGNQWDADHVIARGLGASDEASNLAPICAGKGGCHETKTKRDVSDIAKAKRVSDRHFGVKRPKGFPKPPGVKWDWGRGRYVRERD